MPSRTAIPSSRTAKTRSWIIRAFNRLVLSRPYHRIGVSEVAQAAGVGRSTFYEHFRHKDEVLRHALAPILGMLAEASDPAPSFRNIALVLSHVNEQRDVAYAMLTGDLKTFLLDDLTRHIRSRRNDANISEETARDVAHVQLALLVSWIERRDRKSTAEDHASSIHRASAAILTR